MFPEVGENFLPFGFRSGFVPENLMESANQNKHIVLETNILLPVAQTVVKKDQLGRYRWKRTHGRGKGRFADPIVFISEKPFEAFVFGSVGKRTKSENGSCSRFFPFARRFGD